jgi:O-antigen/teichoic acid export membrane protein
MDSAKPIRIIHITILNFCTRVLFFLFVFVAGYWVARHVPKAHYGELQLITLYAALVWLLFNFGFPNVLVSKLAWYAGQQIRAGITYYIKIGTLFCGATILLGLTFLYTFYIQFGIHVSIWLIAAFVFLQIASTFLQLVLQSLFCYKQLFVAHVFAFLLSLPIVFMGVDALGISAYLLGFCSYHFVVLVCGMLFYYQQYQLFKTYTYQPMHEKVWAWLRPSVHYAFSAMLAAVLWQRYELYAIKQLEGIEVVATVGVAFTLVAIFNEVFKMMSSSLTSTIAAHAHQTDKVTAYVSKFLVYTTWLMAFAALFLYTHIDVITIYIFTPKYSDAIVYARILLLGFIPAAWGYIFINALIGLGQSRFLFRFDLGMAIVTILGMFIGYTINHVQGLFWAKSMAMWLSVVVACVYSYQLKIVKIDIASMVKSIALAAIMVIPFSFMLTQSLIFVGIKGVVLLVVYIVLSQYLGLIPRKQIWKQLNDVFLK